MKYEIKSLTFRKGCPGAHIVSHLTSRIRLRLTIFAANRTHKIARGSYFLLLLYRECREIFLKRVISSGYVGKARHVAIPN